MEELGERRKQILKAVISEYVTSAEPVGSRTISKRYRIDLSPATIRNVMADLEEMGYFVQPHTSSGRVPTTKAFRFFIDELAQFNRPDPNAERMIRERTREGSSLETLISHTSRALSEFTHYAAVGFAAREKASTFRHIQLLRVAPRQILVVYVTDTNLVRNRMIAVERDQRQADLERMSNYLNSLLGGLTLKECRERLIEEMRSDRAHYDALLRQVVEISQAALSESDDQIVIEGSSNILDAPEFGTIERMRALVKAFEEKHLLVSILDKTIESPGVHIFMGNESEDQSLENCALVSGTYGAGGKAWGAIGIIGPMRMDYTRVVPLIEMTSKLISSQIERFHQKFTGDSK